MSEKTNNEVTVLTDHVNHFYSIGCEACDTSVTHVCGENEPARLSYDFPLQIERDKTDSVYILGCAYCGLVDISPFGDDILASKTGHKKFHGFVLAMTHNTPEYYHPIDLIMFECDWLDTLEGDQEDSEYARLSRRDFWAGKVIEDESELAPTEAEQN